MIGFAQNSKSFRETWEPKRPLVKRLEHHLKIFSSPNRVMVKQFIAKNEFPVTAEMLIEERFFG